MWAIRLLNGNHAGQIIPLRPGLYTLGRSSQCHIKLVREGISKEHAKLQVTAERVLIADLNSRNGTFVNGRQIQTAALRPGDKVGLYDQLFEFIEMSNTMPLPNTSTGYGLGTGVGAGQTYPQSPQGYSPPTMNYNGNVAYNPSLPPQQPQASSGQVRDINQVLQVVNNYIEEVALPGVYSLPKSWEFRNVLMGFVALFIIVVTGLAVFPLTRILKDSIEQESQRRALTIARVLADEARPALMNGVESALNTQKAENEIGVKSALIVSNIDGRILAPPTRAGQWTENPFFNRARKEGKESVEQINDNSIGAMVPIAFYDETTGSQKITAYAAIEYDMGALAVDSGKTMSLFIQTLFLAFLFGAALFFIVYKLIEHPIVDLNKQLNKALKEGRDDLKVDYQFPALEQLTANINSALSRAQNGPNFNESNIPIVDRYREAEHIVEVIGHPALVINAADDKIAAINDDFQKVTGLNIADLKGQRINAVTDQALRKSMEDLIQRLKQEPFELFGNEIPMSGYNYELIGQCQYGSDQVASYIFVLRQVVGGGS